MTYEIIIGRSETDRKKFGLTGTVFLGRSYVKMGQATSLSNNVYLDFARSHVVFICGKRGSGKSYTMGVIAEGMAELPPEINQNLSILIFDTMGIYWTMKYPNKKDEELLRQWHLEAKSLDVQVYTPYGYYQTYKDKGIPTDFPFSINPAELSPNDWITTFEIPQNTDLAIFIEKIVSEVKKRKGN